MVDDALIKTFETAANQGDAFATGEALGFGLAKWFATR